MGFRRKIFHFGVFLGKINNVQNTESFGVPRDVCDAQCVQIHVCVNTFTQQSEFVLSALW